MKHSNVIGSLASLGSVIIALAVRYDTGNGRMAQGGVLFELLAFAMFVYAAARGSRWWLVAPLLVVIFWSVVAHIDSLWK